MSNVIIGSPNYSDPFGVLYTPAFGISGKWQSALPLSNLQDRRLYRVTRSYSAVEQDTRLDIDLGVDRTVKVFAIPKHTLSSGGQWRCIGRPSTALFSYVAGESITARGGVFTRVPTTDVKAATFINRAGVLKYAGENRCLQSQTLGTTWVATNVTVASDSIAAPDGTTTADTLTATAGNATLIQDLGVLASAAFAGGLWLKRKTGSGNIQLTLDNGGTWTTVTLTTEWLRLQITQTVANPDFGIRIVTNADAVYAWGAQAEHGATLSAYIPTTTATNSAPRDGHWIDGERTLLLEAAGTNLCLQSENFGTTWAAVGSPTRSAAAHTASGVTLDLIGDDDGAALEGYSQTVTFTADAVKNVSCFVKVGSSTSSVIRLHDTSAAADRLLATLTWSGGLPSVVAATGTYLGYDTLAGGVYRLLFTTAAVTAANTNSLRIYPATDAALATTATGTLYVGGVQAGNNVTPSSYIPTTTATVTRAADSLYFPYTAVPQEMTVYVKGIDRGLTGVANGRLVEIGNGSPRLIVRYSSGLNLYHENGAAVQSTASGTPTVGNTLEVRGVLSSTGTVTAGASINSAAETVGTTSGTNTLAAAWLTQVLYVNSSAAASPSFAYTHIVVSTGTKTMAEMRLATYDSGWLDAWPSGLTSEDLANLNYALVNVVPSTAPSARYWSLQISDPDNTAGYVDLARLVVAGGYQPSINFVGGARLGLESETTRVVTDGGAAQYDDRAMRRVATFAIEQLEDSEAFLQAWRAQKHLGPSTQAFLVLNPDADAAEMIENAFLCTTRELTAIEYPYAVFRRMAFAFTEEL